MREIIRSLFKKCSSIVVYRSSPDEKAQVVRFVMEDPEACTLSIGDGANDVNMIQTATIGIGIQGKEGNQAATFSDYAVPTFQCLRRLVLWHGRTFGYKALIFTTLNIFKGHLFMIIFFYFNMWTGYSAIALCDYFYYSLFNVMNTTINIGGYMVFDQDVAVNPNKYIKDGHGKNNTDGSTNLLSEYFAYIRDYWIKSIYKQFIYYFVLAYFAGAVIFYASMMSMSNTFDGSGKTIDMWNAGVSTIFAVVNIATIQLIIETKNYNWVIFAFYIGTYLSYMPLTVWFNDVVTGIYHKDQFSTVYSCPLLYFIQAVVIAAVVLPRYAWMCYESVIWHPEFTKIKGE